MKNFSIVKGGEKLLAILISLILALSLFSFVGCDVVETPEPVNMVYDVKIQYE